MSSNLANKSASILENLSQINRLASLLKIMILSVLVLYSCLVLFHVNQSMLPANSLAISKMEKPTFQLNSDDSQLPSNSLAMSNTEKTLLQSDSNDSSTNISHLLFAILGSEGAWHHRKGYGEAWWRPNVTRGYLYLDTAPEGDLLPWSSASPPYRVSENIEKLIKEIAPAVPPIIRLVHTILEAFKEGDKEGFRWLVMGDDDTVFFVDNLVDVLAKYDHTDYYYIGCQSDYVKSNFWFSFNMGFGGAGIALSYPLAKALAKDMNGCLRRYAHMNTFDIIAMYCISDLGVNLSPQKGLHQVDMNGDISGFLSAHPKTPLLSLHHFDEVEPIFPGMDRAEAIRHLMKAGNIEQSRLLQQTICFLRKHRWTVSISWGYSVNLYERIIPRSWLQIAIETFQKWVAPNENPPHFMFNTRFTENDPCETPHVFFFESMEKMPGNVILTSYYRSRPRELPPCFASLPADYVSHVHVYSPATKRRQTTRCECCDVSYTDGAKNAVVKFRECKKDEIIA